LKCVEIDLLTDEKYDESLRSLNIEVSEQVDYRVDIRKHISVCKLNVKCLPCYIARL